MEPERFRLLSTVANVEVIAEGRGVRIRNFLRRAYGGRRWRKMKGIARVETHDGWIGIAEIHWYEAHGVGKVDWKIKTRLQR
jgi:hypothetical protein